MTYETNAAPFLVHSTAVLNLGGFSLGAAIQAESPAIDLSVYRDGTVYGSFAKTTTAQFWLGAIDENSGRVVNKVELVPTGHRLLVTDTSTDLAALFTPSVPTPTPPPPTPSTSESSGGGGGGGGCAVGRTGTAMDPSLIALLGIALVGIWRRRAATKRS